jgi:hypothetical protein
MNWTKHEGGYLAPLGRSVAGDWGDVATHILRWYNRTTRDWVVSFANEKGEQIGPSTYVATLSEALAEAEYLSKLDRVPRSY